VGFYRDFTINDLDNDLQKELLIFGSSGLSIIDSTANPIWQFQAKNNREFRFLKVADISGDSIKEIIISDRSNRVSILDAFGHILNVHRAESGPIFVSDLDQDGTKEILIGPTIFDTEFNIKQKLPLSSSEMQIDDLDNDGKQEIIVFYTLSHSYVSSTIICIMNSDGQILWNYEYPTWINSYAIEDLNNDGYKEILISGHHTAPITVFGKQ
jgi:hypothetical protein